MNNLIAWFSPFLLSRPVFSGSLYATGLRQVYLESYRTVSDTEVWLNFHRDLKLFLKIVMHRKIPEFSQNSATFYYKFTLCVNVFIHKLEGWNTRSMVTPFQILVKYMASLPLTKHIHTCP